METEHLAHLATEIVKACVASPRHINPDELRGMIRIAFEEVTNAVTPPLEKTPEPEVADKPARAFTGSVRASIKPDGIISMIDGKPYKTLRRHLTGHGYTPESYRAAFDLPADYPMVAPAYSESRRAMAVKIGLGRKAAG